MERPIFVKIEQYKELTQILSQIDGKIDEAHRLLHDLEQMKEHEETQLKAWVDSLEDVKRRAEEINKALFSKHE